MTEPDAYTCPHVRDGRPCTAIVTFQTQSPSRAECHTRTELCAICAGRVVLVLQAIDEQRGSVQTEVVAVLRAAGATERALLCATCNHVLSAHMRLDGHCAVLDCRCQAYS